MILNESLSELTVRYYCAPVRSNVCKKTQTLQTEIFPQNTQIHKTNPFMRFSSSAALPICGNAFLLKLHWALDSGTIFRRVSFKSIRRAPSLHLHSSAAPKDAGIQSHARVSASRGYRRLLHHLSARTTASGERTRERAFPVIQ
ncbi:hypothetical protein QQF64_029301 [Cirrhinus molitorella]|uniref:Uncharacterized protein n=1 Tax=Cirrhinus molitorella TaxID=172907 RepID=A0ABR3N921_9TELE